MTTIIVLFRLRAGVERSAGERRAREADLPEDPRLRSVDGCDVRRSTGLVSGGPAPLFLQTEAP